MTSETSVSRSLGSSDGIRSKNDPSCLRAFVVAFRFVSSSVDCERLVGLVIGRVSGGTEVALYWSPLDNGTTVEVWDSASDETIVFAVPPERALEAFYHPFAQLAA